MQTTEYSNHNVLKDHAHTRRRIFSNSAGAITEREYIEKNSSQSADSSTVTHSALSTKSDHIKEKNDMVQVNKELPLGIRVFRFAIILIQAVFIFSLIVLVLGLFFSFVFEQIRITAESQRAIRRSRRKAAMKLRGQT